ncbi:hypothetical protein [Aestuariispira ectoiniformans]|uniref:hypothetical protein n=1 Tax=Aestuariispira ectoiniformans TaxID=2775080 RepID=UPI00223C2B2B|nr:hypothetical protein [Aestuariispira ectoiniformans]
MIRTNAKTVTFCKSFILKDVDEVFPAGSYLVEVDEECVRGGGSIIGYKRLLAVMHLPVPQSLDGLTRAVFVDPLELDAVIAKDNIR